MFHNRTLWLLLKSWQAVGANFTSSSLDTRVGSAATESAVHRFVEHRKWITGVHMRSHRSKLQFLVGKRLLSSAEGYKIDGAQHCGKIWGWIFPSDLATAASQPQRCSDLDHTQNKLHSEMMHLPLRLQAILMRKTNLGKSFFFFFCSVHLLKWILQIFWPPFLLLSCGSFVSSEEHLSRMWRTGTICIQMSVTVRHNLSIYFQKAFPSQQQRKFKLLCKNIDSCLHILSKRVQNSWGGRSYWDKSLLNLFVKQTFGTKNRKGFFVGKALLVPNFRRSQTSRCFSNRHLMGTLWEWVTVARQQKSHRIISEPGKIHYLL